MRGILRDGLDASRSGACGTARRRRKPGRKGEERLGLAPWSDRQLPALPVIAPSLLMSCARVRWNAYPGTLNALRSRITPFLYRKACRRPEPGTTCRRSALVVDAERKRRRMLLERSEISDPFTSRPHERAQPGIVRGVARLAGETHDDAVPVDRRRRVPGVPSKRADVVHRAVFPDHRAPRGVSADRLIANAGDAHHLADVVDRGRGAGGVSVGPRGSSRISSVPGPHITGRNWIVRGAAHVWCPRPRSRRADDLAPVVCSGRVPIDAAAECRQWPHPVAFPGEATARVTGTVRPRAKNEAQVHVAADGCSTLVCAIPTMSPESFFTGHATLLSVPPSVPRLTSRPWNQATAFRARFPARLE